MRISKIECGNTSKGFTLVEVIIVIAVIGILAGIGIPAILDWLPNMRLRGASQDLLGDMQLAKLEAVKRNENVAISLNPVVCAPPNIPAANGSYTIFVDLNTDNILDPGEPVIKQMAMPDAVGLCGVALADATNVTTFLSNGLPFANKQGTITLSNTNNISHTLTLNVAGSVSLN